MITRAIVRGVGHYLPRRIVPNSEFEATLDTTDEWIRTRSGIELSYGHQGRASRTCDGRT